MKNKYDLIIVGGGAAGLFAAAYISDRAPELSVLVLEGNDRVGKKLLTTGNGRCNISNASALEGKYHGGVEFAADVFKGFTREKTLEFFKKIGIPTVEEEQGKLFPMSLQAGSVVDALRFKAEENAEILCGGRVSAISYDESIFVTGDRGVFCCDNVLVTCGGRAAANTGSDGSGYELLEAFGHRSNRSFPAIVQIITDTKKTKPLAGIKWVCKVTARAGNEKRIEKGEVLFTDYGLSGPPILQISRLISKRGRGDISLDLFDGVEKQAVTDEIYRRRSEFEERECMELLTGLINKRLGQTVVKSAGISLSRKCGSLTDAEIDRIAESLKDFTLTATGTKGWNMAQVTAGGIDPYDFYSDSMESRLYEGIYAAGEILDIDGDCGGYNLQWAWSTAGLAAESVIKKVKKNNA